MLPFGLMNVPATFQRLMQRVLSDLDDEEPTFADAYIDDTLLFSKTLQEHVRHLCSVFQRLREANLKLKLCKCHFLHESVGYLGYIITSEGLLSNATQLDANVNPTSVTAVWQFLGLTSFYRRFIQHFAKIAGPLHPITRKDIEFQVGR